MLLRGNIKVSLSQKRFLIIILIDNFISDSFALAAGVSGFKRVRVKSQTEQISLLGLRLFQIFSYLINF